jgi:uncharacterized protein DUF4912
MKTGNSKPHARKPGSAFRISGGPVVLDRQDPALAADQIQLPTIYGEPILFAIPRDPHTIFTYWNIDWAEAFARTAPRDRKVYLRLKREDGSDELEEAIEPMLGTHFLAVALPKASYQIELGFYEAPEMWNSVAASDFVTMPADTASENAEVDVATVPFHLSFQRLIDLFRASNGDAIASVLSRFQGRAKARSEQGEELSAEEQEILRAMNISLSDLQDARRGSAGSGLEELLRKRAEAVLGFGGTSPAGGLGGSSWPSGR